MTLDINFKQIDKIRQLSGAQRGVRSRDSFRSSAKTYPEKTTVLAEGDSWFAYPRKYILFGAANNVVDWLKKKHDGETLLIDDIASNGDEAVAMVSGESKLEMLRRLDEEHFDILLFSGGGNDIVGKYDFDYFLLPRAGLSSWQECIHMDRFTRRLEMIERAYADLVELTLQFSCNRDIKIVTHTYDLALPNPKGATFFGNMLKVKDGKSWMHPYLMEKGIVDEEEQKAIVHFMLTTFKDRLIALGEKTGGTLRVVDTHGLVQKDQWLNEIHPDSEGFETVADKIYSEGIAPVLR